MTKKELAKLANVSPSAVTKAFNEADDISQETKKHIFDIAKQNGCYDKFFKGKYRKKIIAVICHEILGEYYSEIVSELKKLIENTNNNIMLLATDDFSSKKQAELIDYFSSYLKVDGIIVIGLECVFNTPYNVPIVAIGNSVNKNVDTILTNTKPTISKAIKTLKKYGHNKIGFLGEKNTKNTNDFIKQELSNNSLTDNLIFESSMRFEEAGIDGINHLLSLDDGITAIICAYDKIALGALKRLKQLSKSIPEDISVIGINNISSSFYNETSLSTIGANKQKVCSAAWELLQTKIKNPYFKNKETVIIESQFIERESIKKLN